LCSALNAGKILIQRDESTSEKLPNLFYSKLPSDIATRNVLICDPMLGTGGSVKMAISVLQKAGVSPSRIIFLNLLSCPEGIKAVHEDYPDVTIVTGTIDEALNEHKYITPGLGDLGDRYYGT
jgi:uracil phosphoribosyltransferase